jgi:hypothetical protein
MPASDKMESIFSRTILETACPQAVGKRGALPWREGAPDPQFQTAPALMHAGGHAVAAIGLDARGATGESGE